jgi:hypothetical protein
MENKLILTKEHQNVLSRTREEFFKNSPITIDLKKSYVQGIEQDGRMWFGVVAGPTADIGNLFHEMAHFVEIDEKRMGKHGWGLKLPRMHCMPGPYGGHSWCEPKTIQISMRELRTFAYQHHLHQYFGIDTWRDRVADLLYFLADWHNIPGVGKEAKERWILSVYDRLVKSPKYSLASFTAEWERRNTILTARYKRRKVGQKNTSKPS